MERRTAPRRVSGAMALAWGLLIGYATLFPFVDWRWPPGATLGDLLNLPWPRWRDGFDMFANWLAYVPLGLFLALAWAGSTRRPGWGPLLGAALAGAALSFALEVAQQLLPPRVPSLLDVAMNAAGAATGSGLAWLMARWGWAQRLASERERWLVGGVVGPVLLLLWPMALLFPSPLPLGLGQIGPVLRDAAVDLLVDVGGVQALMVWLEQPAVRLKPSPPLVAWVAACSLFGACATAFACSRPGWRRLALAGGALLTALAASALSAALSFGPAHALAWMSPGTEVGLALGVLLAALLARAATGWCAVLALMALTGSITAVALAPPDPYFAQNLQAWETGRFIRFHGLAQWLSWLWPFAAMAWLLGRLRLSAGSER